MSEQSIHQLHMKRLKGLLELFSRRLIVCFKSHRDQSSGHNRVLGVTPGPVNCKQWSHLPSRLVF
jgi:hypothetical protein